MPSPSLDDLVQRIRAEAAKLERELPAIPVPQQASPTPALPRLPDLPKNDWYEFLHREQLNIVDLLGFEGDDFIELAYQAVLGRAADPGGRDGIRQAFADGVPRLEILTRLRLSAEGRKYGRRLHGWTPLLNLLHATRSIPLGRRLIRPAFKWLERRQQNRGSAMALHSAKYANEHFSTLNEVLGKLSDALNDAASRRVSELEQQLRGLRAEIAELEQLGHQNRHDILYLGARESAPLPAAAAAPAPAVASDEVLDAYYVAFEDANRGSREEIRAKQLGYIALLAAELAALREMPLLDVGCGRGEWLALLAEHGYRGRGIDLNPVMVKVCREQGLTAECTDILSGLAVCPDNSLAAVTAFQLIEHLPFPVLYSAIEQAWRALAPGGLLILETPNPENLLVGSHTFYHDFTHRNPITPSAISFLASYLNFADIRIERLNPYPESAKVPGRDLLTERVNGHLCGPQDFALIARKPQPGETGKAAG